MHVKKSGRSPLKKKASIKLGDFGNKNIEVSPSSKQSVILSDQENHA